MQNFPGAGNRIQLGGRPMRNWWDTHANFGAAVESDTGLTQPPSVYADQQHAFARTSSGQLAHWWVNPGADFWHLCMGGHIGKRAAVRWDRGALTGLGQSFAH